MRRASGLAVAAVVSVLLAACGAATTTDTATSTAVTTATSTGAASTKVVTYAGVSVTVPSSWPVYDLTATPHRCALLNMHAVYLGHQQADATCPTHALGKTEAVQVEPDDAVAKARVVPSANSATINGLSVAYEPGGVAEHQVVATFGDAGVVVTATYGSDPGQAQQIVASVRRASS